MKNLQKIIFSFLLFAFLCACSAAPVLHDSNGNTVNFADYQGKWLIINYWATWCKPCYKEIPALNAFYAAHKDKDVVMFGVSYDQAPPEKLAGLIKQIGVQFPTLTSDPAAQLRVKEVDGLPTTLVFYPNGKLKQVLMGEQTQASLEKAIK
jgi:thiol-disulfide isomerase/thioredoxin